MAWNPDTYNRFKTERFAPFEDIAACIRIRPGMDVTDLGCGTGELTRKLADRLPDSRVWGIDSSAEMLQQAEAFVRPGLRFDQIPVEDWLNRPEKWDLLFSNAALQWVNDHENLFPALITRLKPGGVLAVQMPAQNDNILNRMLDELSAEEPYASALQSRPGQSPVLEPEAYAQLFFENGGSAIHVAEKIYPLVVPNTEGLFTWVSGSTLIRYRETLPGALWEPFVHEFKRRLQLRFPKTPVFYPFKRMLLYAEF